MKILITRTVPFPLFERAIKRVKEKFSDSHITVMVQSSYQGQIKDYDSIVVPDGMFKLSNRTFSIVKEIRSRGFDMLVLLYNNPAGRGYLNLYIFSVLTGINKVMIYDVNDNIYQVSSKTGRIIKKLIANTAGRLIYIFMNAVISVWNLWRRENGHQSTRAPEKTGHQSISLFILVTGVLVHWCTIYL
ncbi:MAG: hypothetical protein HY279_03485 [Nitrospinae bacterium]|nr:hypothetical protein [Nitrospinota bacterium]